MSARHARSGVAVVTGGGAGIGAGAAVRLARSHEVVVLADRDQDAAAATADHVRAGGAEPHVARTDVASDDDLRALAATVGERWGRCDVLVTAAGIQRYGTVDQTSASAFDEVVGVNLRGVFGAAHHLVPLIRSAGGGAIVVVASVQAFATQSGVAAYAATKGALISLVRAMAVDHAHEGIRVNAVCPGSVDTPMLRAAAARFAGEDDPDDVIATWGRSHPLGRVATTDEVAEAIAYLAGPQASFVTGADLRVDGGLLSAQAVALPASAPADDGTPSAPLRDRGHR